MLELPGQDFSYYRWGTTADPLTPGLMDRPFVSRELTPYGTPGSAALIRALDRRMQEGVFEPGSVAPVSRLLGVGDVVLRSDLQYERFRTPRPRRTYAELTEPGIGLQDPRGYGPPALEKPSVPFTDEVTLGTPPSAAEAPSVAVFGVQGAQPIVRAERAQQPLVVDGDAEGLVDAAAAGVINGSGPILFGANLTPEQRQQALGADADLLVTDSNRDRAERWGSLRENLGYTEGPGEQPLEEDPTDNRLPVFGDAAEGGDTGVVDPSKTQTELSGIAAVRATTYGNPLSYVPADRPAGAIDGDPTTAWRVGAFDDVRDEKLRIDLKAPVRTDRITLLQPVTGPRNRYLTRVGVSINGGPEQSVALGDASRRRPGQVVQIPAQDVRRVEITTHDTNLGLKSQYLGDSGVGFAEIGIPGVRGEELVSMPTDTLDAAGPASLDHRLLLQMSRERSDPAEPVKQDGELAMQRAFTLPTQRSLAVTGTARISAAIPDDEIDALLGQNAGAGSGLRVTSSEFLPGSLASRGSSAFDGDPATAWTSPFGQPTGQWVQAASPKPVTVRPDEPPGGGRRAAQRADGRAPQRRRRTAEADPPAGDPRLGHPGRVDRGAAALPRGDRPDLPGPGRVGATGEHHRLLLPHAAAAAGGAGRGRPAGSLDAAGPRPGDDAVPERPADRRRQAGPRSGLRQRRRRRGAEGAGRDGVRAGSDARAGPARAAHGRGTDHRHRPGPTRAGLRRGRRAGRGDAGGDRGPAPGPGGRGGALGRRGQGGPGELDGPRDRRRARQAVLVGARPESERRLARHHQRHLARHLTPDRRLRERLAGHPDQRRVHGRPEVDAAADGLDRSRDQRGGGAAVPRARVLAAAALAWRRGDAARG